MPLEEGTSVGGRAGRPRQVCRTAGSEGVGCATEKIVKINKIRLGWGKGDLNVIGIWQRIQLTRFRV